MSLSELFKPWLGSCSACATPRPNVALVLQYLQALRVSLTLSLKKKKSKERKKLFVFRFLFSARVRAAAAWPEPRTRAPLEPSFGRRRNEAEAYLLGLLAKIKCSICSYQLNLWYVAHGVT